MNKPVIICVDDDKLILYSLQILLEENFGNAYSIELLENSQQVMITIENNLRNDREVALVIADYIMPGLKGDELLINIHAKYPSIITILLSGQASIEGLVNAFHEANLYRFIYKPLDSADFIQTVSGALETYEKERNYENILKEEEKLIVHLENQQEKLKIADKKLRSIIKTTQTISEDLFFDESLTHILNITSEYVNAERGIFILEKDSNWYIEATYDTDQQNFFLQKLNIIESYIEVRPFLSLKDTFEIEIENQVTNTVSKITIPNMIINSDPVFKNNAFIDFISKKISGSVTIFQVIPQGLLRIATNVLKSDGTRATGTYIPKESAVYKTIIKKNIYTGRASVVDTSFYSVYKPLLNKDGELIGALYTGELEEPVPLLEENELNYPVSLINHVIQNQGMIVGNTTKHDKAFDGFPYLKYNGIKSFLCLPLIIQRKIIGVIYLENRLHANNISIEEVEILTILTTQAAISINNARLFENLKDSREKYRRVFENTGSGTIIIDKDDTISLINTQFADYIGYSKDQIEGVMTWDQLVSKEDYAAYKKQIEKVWESDKHVQVDLEITFLDRYDNQKSILSTFGKFSEKEKQVIGSFIDITRLKKAEAELSRHKDHLETLVQERTKEVWEKNQEIMESIQYASRIQTSILPDKYELKSFFKKHFVLWKPRDVVGGDFYWGHKTENSYLFAVGDCTGHGIPGALMTMTVNSILNRIVTDYIHDNPARILKMLNKFLKLTLKQQTEEAISDDGVDLTIILYDKNRRTLKFAGARHLLFYCNQNYKVESINGDRQSIGYVHSPEDYQFTNHELDLEKVSSLYLTTDGFLDQIGGEKELSFGKKKFIKLIEENCQKKPGEQKEIFINTIQAYRGTEFPQLDDITVIGIEL